MTSKTNLNRNRRSARKAKRKPLTKSINRKLDQPDQPDCPYRTGTLYGTLFTEGNRDYVSKDELIRKVAEMTNKSEKVVNFAFQVLKSAKHRSNKGRSTVIEENGEVKLIRIRNQH